MLVLDDWEPLKYRMFNRLPKSIRILLLDSSTLYTKSTKNNTRAIFQRIENSKFTERQNMVQILYNLSSH